MRGEGVPGRRKQGRDAGCGRRAADHRLGDVARAVERAAGEHPFFRGVHRHEGRDRGKTVRGHVDADLFRQLDHGIRRFQPHRQHHQINDLLDLLALDADVVQTQVALGSLGFNPVDARADEPHPVFVFGPLKGSGQTPCPGVRMSM